MDFYIATFSKTKQNLRELLLEKIEKNKNQQDVHKKTSFS